MTVLTAFKEAAKYLIGEAPPTLFGSLETFEIKMQAIANEAAQQIAEDNDWQAIKKLAVLSGDGVNGGIDLPTDYHSMLLTSEIKGQNGLSYEMVTDANVWLDLTLLAPAMAPGYVSIFDNKLNVLPVLPLAQQVRFFYKSKDIVLADNQTPKQLFTADSDTFKLNERLLKLAMIWRYRAGEGLEYSEDMQNYEILKSQLETKDAGSKVITGGGYNTSVYGIIGR